MAIRVFHHAVAVAPEHIGDGHLDGAIGFDRAVKGGVRIRDVNVEGDARAATAFGERLCGGKFTGHHQHGIADLHLAVHQ